MFRYLHGFRIVEPQVPASARKKVTRCVGLPVAVTTSNLLPATVLGCKVELWMGVRLPGEDQEDEDEDRRPAAGGRLLSS